MAKEPDWEEVERYTQQRRQDSGDIYGWFRPEGDEPVAVILAAENSSAGSFPREIAGIRVIVKNIAAPEKQA
jgi:hypothetical protein